MREIRDKHITELIEIELNGKNSKLKKIFILE